MVFMDWKSIYRNCAVHLPLSTLEHDSWRQQRALTDRSLHVCCAQQRAKKLCTLAAQAPNSIHLGKVHQMVNSTNNRSFESSSALALPLAVALKAAATAVDADSAYQLFIAKGPSESLHPQSKHLEIKLLLGPFALIFI